MGIPWRRSLGYWESLARLSVTRSAGSVIQWASSSPGASTGRLYRSTTTRVIPDAHVSKFGFSACSWADAAKRGVIKPRPKALPLSEFLAGPRRNRSHIKRRLIAAGLKENRCEQCGISEWENKPLSLALHHVNGDGRDNRLENLVLLCPNCHSQTPNFGVKGWKLRKVDAEAA